MKVRERYRKHSIRMCSKSKSYIPGELLALKRCLNKTKCLLNGMNRLAMLSEQPEALRNAE